MFIFDNFEDIKDKVREQYEFEKNYLHSTDYKKIIIYGILIFIILVFIDEIATHTISKIITTTQRGGADDIRTVIHEQSLPSKKQLDIMKKSELNTAKIKMKEQYKYDKKLKKYELDLKDSKKKTSTQSRKPQKPFNTKEYILRHLKYGFVFMAIILIMVGFVFVPIALVAFYTFSTYLSIFLGVREL